MRNNEDIYQDFHGKVYEFILSKTNNADIAEDLSSEVFLKVYEKLSSFDETKAALSTWIYTITRNTLIDHYRTRRTFEEVSETLRANSSVEEDVFNSDMLETLANALEQLEERERDIIILRFYSGKTLMEISEKLKISYVYVKVLQKHAFTKIKNFFGEGERG